MFIRNLCRGLVGSFLFSLALTRAFSATSELSVADQGWDQLSRNWSSNQRGGGGQLAGDFALLSKAHIQNLVQTSQAANEFYTKNPLHPKAKQARKVEAVSLIMAAHSGGVEHEPTAIRLSMAFRNDLTNDEADRFEVASAMDNLLVYKNGNQSPQEVLSELEKKADSLIAEFPRTAEVYRIYVGIMRASPEAKARTVAQKIMLAPAPAVVKEEAQVLLDRWDLIGKKMSLEFTSVNGSSFNLDDQKGSVVVAYVWTAQSGYAELVFKQVAKIPSQISVVGINIDQDVVAAAAVVQQNSPRGLQYADPRGLKSPIAKRLKTVDVPSFYVFDRTGNLVGFSGFDGLEDLLALAAK